MSATAAKMKIRLVIDLDPRTSWEKHWREARLAWRRPVDTTAPVHEAAVRAGWTPDNQVFRPRLWPSWHPLTSGKERRMPLTREAPTAIGMEYDYVARRARDLGPSRAALP